MSWHVAIPVQGGKWESPPLEFVNPHGVATWFRINVCDKIPERMIKEVPFHRVALLISRKAFQ